MSVVVSSPIFLKITFNGGLDGPISVPGIKASDTILKWITPYGENRYWISADDTLRQGAGQDLSSMTLTAILIRWP